MKQRKNLSRVWQLKKIFISLSVALLGACFPLTSDISLARHQQAFELVDKGTILLRAGQLEEAQGAFAAAAEMGPIAAAIDGLGCIAFMRKDLVLAERYFVEAYEMDKNYFNSLGNLALLYEVAGNSEKSEQLYAMALEAEPENFRTRNNFAGHLHDKLERQAARNELLKALALAKHPVVIGNLMGLENYE